MTQDYRELFESLTKAQREAAFSDRIASEENPHDRLDEPYIYARHFHYVFNLSLSDVPVLNPTVTDRELRLKLLLEEVKETVEAMGFKLAVLPYGEGPAVPIDSIGDITVAHVEGSKYDPVETQNGLADIEVIVNGTAVSLGLDMQGERHETYCSNMSKLGPDGLPIINGVTRGYRCFEDGVAPEIGFRPDLPIGKVLKPDTYIKANSAAVFVRHYYATKGE